MLLWGIWGISQMDVFGRKTMTDAVWNQTFNIRRDAFCKEPVAARASLEIPPPASPPPHPASWLSDHQPREKVSMESANKRRLNKLAPGHIIQTQGIVLGWQASTGRCTSREAAPGIGMGLLCLTQRIIKREKKSDVGNLCLCCCMMQINNASVALLEMSQLEK